MKKKWTKWICCGIRGVNEDTTKGKKKTDGMRRIGWSQAMGYVSFDCAWRGSTRRGTFGNYGLEFFKSLTTRQFLHNL